MPGANPDASWRTRSLDKTNKKDYSVTRMMDNGTVFLTLYILSCSQPQPSRNTLSKPPQQQLEPQWAPIPQPLQACCSHA